jgi:hypothetical protein
MLFIGGNPAISDWAACQSDIRIGFLGGKSNHAEIRVMGVALATIYNHSLKTFSDLGHRRILAVLWSSNPQVAQVISLLHANFHGIPLERLPDEGLLITASQGTPRQRRDEFIRVFRKSKPTAVVVDGLFEYIVVWTALLELGLKVPHDVSILNVVSDDQLTKLTLVPTHYRVEPRFMIREIHAWIRGKPCNGLYVKPRLFMPYFEEAKSLLADQLVQEMELVRLRMVRMSSHIPDALYMIDNTPSPALSSSFTNCIRSSSGVSSAHDSASSQRTSATSDLDVVTGAVPGNPHRQ